MEATVSSETADFTFSVIIPVYNRVVQLAACVASLRAQTFRDFELIVVDDGSTDGTCDSFVGEADVRVLTKANGGPSSARNFGVAAARGRYIFFLDSDDLALPWTLQCFAAAIEAGEDPDIVCGNFVEFVDVPPAIAWCESKIVPYRDYLAAAETGLYAAGGMIAVKRRVFLASGGFDPAIKVAEDHDLMLRLGERPGFVHVAAPPTYVKHDHAGSISKSLSLMGPGCTALLAHFEAGFYGTSARARRIAGDMVGSHVRSAVVSLARNGLLRDSFALYRRAIGLNVAARRWKFVLAAPAVMVAGVMRGARR
ncbi:MAG: glycosyltransferase [Sphingomonas sp.]|uniref:glycosyltransferase family 2 protein n=1 Tax=Sphingomonas sp. TaxID=28214 RepID=UPI003568E131